jgi:hypothetical protein
VVMGFFAHSFFVYYTVAMDGRTDGVGRSVGAIQRMLPCPLFFSLLFWAAQCREDGGELMFCRPQRGRFAGYVRGKKNAGPRRLRWCCISGVSATELGVGQLHSRGRGRCNILDMVKWWCSLFGSICWPFG